MIAEVSLGLAIDVAAAAYVSADANRTAPDNVRSIIEKTKSFARSGSPVSFWNYTNLAEHGQHMDEAAVEEWADAGFTVPQSPTYDPGNLEQICPAGTEQEKGGYPGIRILRFAGYRLS